MARKDPYLPIELEVISEQLRREEGRFIFRLQWQLGVTPDQGVPWMRWRHIRGSTTNWNAGSIDEMLTAIDRVIVELASSPGIRREKRSNNRAPFRCKRCGGFTFKGSMPHECIKSRRPKP